MFSQQMKILQTLLEHKNNGNSLIIGYNIYEINDTFRIQKVNDM